MLNSHEVAYHLHNAKAAPDAATCHRHWTLWQRLILASLRAF